MGIFFSEYWPLLLVFGVGVLLFLSWDKIKTWRPSTGGLFAPIPPERMAQWERWKRVPMAIAAGVLVLFLFFATDSTLDFFGLVLSSKIFWAIFFAALIFWVVLRNKWDILIWPVVILVIWWTILEIRSCGTPNASSGVTGGNRETPALSSGRGTLLPGESQRIWAVPGRTFFRADHPVKLKYSLVDNPSIWFTENPTDKKPWPSDKRVRGYWEVKNLSSATTVLVEWGP